MDIFELPRGSQRGLTLGSFKNKWFEEIMDTIFKGIQKMNYSDSKHIMIILFKYNRALQDKIATHRTSHLPSVGTYVPSSTATMITWKRKELGHKDSYCESMVLVWR